LNQWNVLKTQFKSKRAGLFALGLPLLAALLQSCNGMGYQGGIIPSAFQGITSAQAISPRTLQLNWTAHAGTVKYNIYTPESGQWFKQNSFNSLIYSPTNPNPNIIYQFSVTAIDPSTGDELGDRSTYSKVQLLPNFSFSTTGSARSADRNSIFVQWTAYPSVTYSLYIGERLASGAVQYDFNAPTLVTPAGVGAVQVKNLLEGHEYCAVAVADYGDNSTEGPNGVEIAPTMTIKDFMSRSAANSPLSIASVSQQCARTQTNASFSNVKVFAQMGSLSDQPNFYVFDRDDRTEDAQGNVNTSIYDVVDEVTGQGQAIATRTGTGKVSSSVHLTPGKHHFYAVVTDINTGAQNKTQLVRGLESEAPTAEKDQKYFYVRSMGATESVSRPVGHYPKAQQGGYGSQKAGSSVAVGDFNCDGYDDLAVGVPDAMSFSKTDSLPAKVGKVVIYYGNHSSPSSIARTQEITFDVSSLLSDGRDLRLGTSLYVGNFNHDNEFTNNGDGMTGDVRHQCMDLAIGSGFGPLFVLYGKRNLPGSPGGLNYVNSTSYDVNPTGPCDSASNLCSPSAYIHPSAAVGTGYALGAMMTSGDYDGDGHEDLAVTSAYGYSPYFSARGIWVLRGSPDGLMLPQSFSAGTNSMYSGYPTGSAYVDSVSFPTGAWQAIPYLSIDLFLQSSSHNSYGTGWGGGGFGSSLSTLHNAYFDCAAETGSGVTLECSKGSGRVRDVLLIGNPSVNLVHVCKPGSSDSTGSVYGTISSAIDPASSLKWDCSGSITTTDTNINSLGLAMTDIKNALLYRADEFAPSDIDNSTDFPNYSYSKADAGYLGLGFPGGVAISASGFSASVLMIYGVARPSIPSSVSLTSNKDSTATTVTSFGSSSYSQRFKLGWAKNYWLNSLISTPITIANAVTDSPCSINSGAESCKVQRMTSPFTGNNLNDRTFGAILASLPGDVDTAQGKPKDHNLAVVSKEVSIIKNSVSYPGVGRVSIYRQNALLNGTKYTATQASNPVYRFADGFSSSSRSTLDFDQSLYSNIKFGSGGVAGGSLSNPPYSDIVVGVPGSITQITNSDGSKSSVIDNGSAMTYFSMSGQYRSYAYGDTSTSPWHILDRSFGQESNLRFNQAVSIGDVNLDGIGDLAVRINQGVKNTIMIYPGLSSGGVGVDESQAYALQAGEDNSAGKRFIPVGQVNPGASSSFFMTGDEASYLFFGGNGKVLSGFPSVGGSGGAPRKYGPPTNLPISNSGKSCSIAGFEGTSTGHDCVDYFPFTDDAFWNAETGSIDSSIQGHNNFAVGDFNGDGYMDLAIGIKGSDDVGYSNTGTFIAARGSGTTSNSGRVLILYGGADNGFQTGADSYGGYPLHSNYFQVYSGSSESGVTASLQKEKTLPCSSSGTGCKIQMIYEPGETYFGMSLAAIPMGDCAVSGSGTTTHQMSGLVVQGISNSDRKGDVFVYTPKCKSVSQDLSGLQKGPTSTLELSSRALKSSSFGTSLAPASNLSNVPATGNNWLFLGDQNNMKIYVWKINSTGSLTLSDTFDFSSSVAFSGMGGGSAMGFADSIVDAGDLNGDGYHDVVVNISRLGRKETASTITNQGGYLILYGYGRSGLSYSRTVRAKTSADTIINPSRVADCYVYPYDDSNSPVSSSICNPTLFFLPQMVDSSNSSAFTRNGVGDRTSLSGFSAIKPNQTVNEGLGSVILGSPGRDGKEPVADHRLIQGGVFYEIP